MKLQAIERNPYDISDLLFYYLLPKLSLAKPNLKSEGSEIGKKYSLSSHLLIFLSHRAAIPLLVKTKQNKTKKKQEWRWRMNQRRK